MSDTDRIEKQIVLKAPRSRVWRAITDSQQFGRWFGVEVDVPFTPGAHVVGRILHPDYKHLPFEVWIDRIEPERLFSMRWIPDAGESGVDGSAELTTLVEFTLAEVEGGTRVTIVESGFDGLPLERRLKAYRSNTGGWEEQAGNLERHVLAGL